MLIELSGLDSRQIISILRNYPSGSLEIKGSLIFWKSDTIEPRFIEPPLPPDGYPPRTRQTQNQQAGRVVKRMSDSLGAMIC